MFLIWTCGSISTPFDDPRSARGMIWIRQARCSAQQRNGSELVTPPAASLAARCFLYASAPCPSSRPSRLGGTSSKTWHVAKTGAQVQDFVYPELFPTAPTELDGDSCVWFFYFAGISLQMFNTITRNDVGCVYNPDSQDTISKKQLPKSLHMRSLSRIARCTTRNDWLVNSCNRRRCAKMDPEIPHDRLS